MQLTWNRYIKLINQLIGNFKEDYDYIVGIEISGLIPATIIAKKLKKELYSIKINHPKNSYYAEIVIREMPVAKNILLVDDILKTGRTMEEVVKLLPARNKVFTAAIIDELGKTDYCSLKGKKVTMPYG